MMSSGDGEAKLYYGSSAFKVLRGGKFVRCAVSGEAIPLEELRYWSVVKQEPYVSAEASARAALAKG